MQFYTYVPQTPALREYCKKVEIKEDSVKIVDDLIEQELNKANSQDPYQVIKPSEEIADYKRDLKYVFKALEVKTQIALGNLKDRNHA